MYYDTTIILLIPAMIFAMVAQGMVKKAFNRYSKVANSRNMTGAQAARQMLDANGLRDVEILQTKGSLTDNYNPRKRTLNLSQTVYGVNSISAVSVACHEAGHAIQHARHYAPLTIRNTIVPVVNIGSALTWPLVIVGILLLSSGSFTEGNLIFNIGVFTFLGVILFHLITLPVEFNASRRAVDQMEELAIILPEEKGGAKKVLRAAAMTYVAALAVAVANLLRILAIRGRN